jgi:hypothetical protein
MPKPVIGFHINKDFCASSDASRPCEDNLIRYLASFPDSINVLYNLDYSAACLIRRMKLTQEQCQHLLTNTKLWIEPLKVQLTYIPEKFLAIRYGEVWDSPYSMYSAGDQYLIAKVEDGGLDYCYQRACEARDAGIQVRDALSLLKVDAENIVSPINQFAKRWYSHWSFPTTDDVPEQVGQYAWECLDAGWFDNVKKGQFTAWDYDISSAYGHSLSTCPDHRKGKWYSVKELGDVPIGFYKTNVTITAPFSPIGYRITKYDPIEQDEQQSRKLHYTPVGTWTRYLSRQQIDFINKWNLGTVEIIDGVEWEPQELKMVYAPLMKRLYEIKEANQGAKRNAIKRVMNGVWGLTLQIEKRTGKFGDYVDTVTGALVEINTRLKVASLCFENGIIPINVMLDGLTVDRPLENIDLGKGLGQWKLAYEAKPCIAVNADVCLIESKSSEQLFTLEFEWLKSEIESNPDAQEYTMVRKSPITLGKALQENKLDQLGDIVDTRRSVNVTVESKRMFPEMPTCGRDLLEHQYSSLPLSVDMIELSNIQDEEGLTDEDDGDILIVPDEEFNLEDIE